MKRIAIFGGTFNPIHLGHLMIAEQVSARLGLSKVIFIPSYTPPHKTKKKLASAQDRLAMVKKAIVSNPLFEVSDIEIKRKGKSYTIDTIRQLKKRLKKRTRLLFIIGADSLSELKDWKDIRDIFTMVTFIVVNRPGFAFRKSLQNSVALETPGIEVSSSQIRSNISKGISVRYFVPEKVRDYIIKKGLYKKR
ncbi:nicotinate-nucleotide adenylyltransferase [Candidatus Omnitrophota bacterium]